MLNTITHINAIKTKVIFAFVLLFFCRYNYAQTYEIQFGDTINIIDKNGLKQGFWMEDNKSKTLLEYGEYEDNKRAYTWTFYNYILDKSENKYYNVSGRRFRRIRAKFGQAMEWNKLNDSNIYIGLFIKDFTLKKTYNGFYSNIDVSPHIDSLNLKITNITKNITYNLTYKPAKATNWTFNSDSTNNKKYIEEGYYKLQLEPNSEYQIVFAKKGFLTKKININTFIPTYNKLHDFQLEIGMSNKVISESDPIILTEQVANYKITYIKEGQFKLEKDKIANQRIKIRLDRMNLYEKKQRILELENSVNAQILDLKEEQTLLEAQKKLKEEELRHQEEEIKRKQLELQLLAKDKAVSDLTIKAKEAELLKNMLLANEKKKEIERLNQQKLIDELSIKNKESEIAQKNIEAENKQKQIHGLEKEKELSNENLKQQKFIQKLMIAGSGLLGVFLLFVFFSLAKSRNANKLIAAQKTEVEKQKIIAEKQKDIAEEQKHLLQEKQTEIIESITYAKRLQEAILPPFAFIDSNIKNNFILYKPKDIVAGDFYWAENIGDLFFIAAADSTGHGVPGAMVSVVCSNALNRSVKEFHLTETGKILDKTKELVVETFEKSTSEVKDGMDISLLCIDTKNKKVFWSGANNPLWYVCSSKENESHTELVEVKADKQPIGKTDKVNPFTTHEIEFKENTTFYLFTDGFADQFGGPNGKKFKYKPFAEILVQNVTKTPSEQSAILAEKFEAWKGELEQVDDVCIIGVKI